MRNTARILFTTLVATSLLGIAVGGAVALRSIEVSVEGGGSRVEVAVPRFSFIGTEEGRQTIICALTILRTIPRTFRKLVGVLIGKVSGIAAEGCTTNLRLPAEITFLECTPEAGRKLCIVAITSEPAWHQYYTGITGTLPEITAINFVTEDFPIRIHVGFTGQSCLYSGRIRRHWNIGGGRGSSEGEGTGEELTMSRREGEPACPPGLTTAGTSEAIRPTMFVRLI